VEVLRLDGSVSSSNRTKILNNCNEMVPDLTTISKNGFNLSGVGNLPNRALSLIKSFIKPKVFLIQINAGGVGLNLQGFSRVYITSPDWNPCNEIQAIARSHRIGQTNKVIVKKLLLKGEEGLSVIDDRICQIQMNKRNEMADLLEEESIRCNGIRKTLGLTASNYKALLGNASSM
jgi:SNF2 family DNA or RNA helicase